MRMSYLIAPFTTSVRPRGVLRVYNSIPFAKQTREGETTAAAQNAAETRGEGAQRWLSLNMTHAKVCMENQCFQP